jgi:hypothetical protein
MKTDEPSPGDPRALREVWAWKDTIHQEVRSLPLPQAIHAIMDMARKASADATFTARGASPAARLRVAESRDKFGTASRDGARR